MTNPLIHIDLLPYILNFLPNNKLIKNARVSKIWHLKIRQILKNRFPLDVNIASALHNHRWSTQELKSGLFPCKIIAKKDEYLYVSYHNSRVSRWNLKTGETDKHYAVAYDPSKLKVRGNFLFCYGSFNHLHFTHVITQKTFVKIGNYYNAWNDWIIYLTVHIGLFHYATKEMHVLHCNVEPSSRIVNVIDNKLVTYNRGVVYLWDLIGKSILIERPFFGIFYSIKRSDEVMIWYIKRSRNGGRNIFYRSLESAFCEWVPVNRNVHILNSAGTLYTLDKSLQILSGNKLHVHFDKDFKSHQTKIYHYGSYIVTNDARIYRIVKGHLKEVKEYQGAFFPDGTMAVIKKDRVVILGLNQEALSPLKERSLLSKIADRIKF